MCRVYSSLQLPLCIDRCPKQDAHLFSLMALCLQVGKRLTKVSMISGSIVRVWGALESVLVRSESILSKSDRTMRIVRVNTGEAMSLVGAWRCLPPHEHRVITS